MFRVKEVRFLSIGEELTENLAYKISFYIPLGDFKIPVPHSVVVTWGVMAFLVIVSIIFTRKMKIVPGKRQAFIEFCIEKLYNIFYDILGERGKRYIPYLLTVLLYLGISNMLGLFGIAPPTKDLNTTAGLALMSIILIQYAGIHQRGRGRMAEAFRTSDRNDGSDEHSGADHPAAVSVHATVRKYSRRVYHHGARPYRRAGCRSAGCGSLFRYLRCASAGVCVLFPHVFVYSGIYHG